MRSLVNTNGFADRGKKFQSSGGDLDFTITHNSTTFVVDTHGEVLSPLHATLVYVHDDTMVGNQSGITGKVRDFLTVDVTMDSPESKVW